MLKINTQLFNNLLFTSINNSKVISSNNKNNEKLTKFTKLDFIKTVCKVEEPKFLTLNTKQTFT